MNTYRNALAQFRMGVSQINVHRHRYSMKSENLDCPFCRDTTETEIHFVFECPMYKDLRVKYLQSIINYVHLQNHDISILKDLENNVIDFARFLFYAFKLRLQNLLG